MSTTEVKYKDLPSDQISGLLTIKDMEGRYWRPVMIGKTLKMIETDESGLIEIEND